MVIGADIGFFSPYCEWCRVDGVWPDKNLFGHPLVRVRVADQNGDLFLVTFDNVDDPVVVKGSTV